LKVSVEKTKVEECEGKRKEKSFEIEEKQKPGVGPRKHCKHQDFRF